MIRCFFAPSVLALAVAWMLAACATPPTDSWTVSERAPASGPSVEAFRDANVNLFLQHRCGSLDCHGQPARPLRLFGSNGLRLYMGEDAGPPELREAAELEANFQSVVLLEPELLPRVLAAKNDEECRTFGVSTGRVPDVPEAREERCLHWLLIVAKPLGCGNASHGCETGHGVEHKGGPVIALGSDGYRCIIGWLRGRADRGACLRAIGVRDAEADVTP